MVPKLGEGDDVDGHVEGRHTPVFGPSPECPERAGGDAQGSRRRSAPEGLALAKVSRLVVLLQAIEDFGFHLPGALIDLHTSCS